LIRCPGHRLTRALLSPALRPLTFRMVHSPQRGALPTLRAATDPSAQAGEYYGPGGWREYTGYPVRVRSSDRSHDVASRRRLWEISEQLTGVSYLDAHSPGDPAQRHSSR
jgi:hypothetical protein